MVVAVTWQARALPTSSYLDRVAVGGLVGQRDAAAQPGELEARDAGATRNGPAAGVDSHGADVPVPERA